MGNTVNVKVCKKCRSEINRDNWYRCDCDIYVGYKDREEMERPKRKVTSTFAVVDSYLGSSSAGLVLSDGDKEYKVSAHELAKAFNGKTLDLTLEEVKHGSALTWRIVNE